MPTIPEEVARKILDTFPILAFFKWDHLPGPLATVSRPFGELAWDRAMQAYLDMQEPPSSVGSRRIAAETATGLRKLLEAKDCFVRAAVKP